MADRVSATITIGGNLPARLQGDLSGLVQDEGLSEDWDGPRFNIGAFRFDRPLQLMAHEVPWGRFNRLEAFCIRHDLPFQRLSGSCPGQWGAECVVFSGEGEPASFEANDNGEVLVSRQTVERLGSLEAVLAHFDAAVFVHPPLVLLPDQEEADHG